MRLESGLDGTPVYVLGVVTNQQLLQGQPNICGGGGVAMGLYYSFVICMFHQVNNVCFEATLLIKRRIGKKKEVCM